MFSIPFTLYFLLFAWVANLGFGAVNENYLSISRTIATQFLHLLGATDFEGTMDLSPIFGPMYFLAYTGFMMFIVFNMFMAIICEAIDGDYDEEFEKQAGDIQVIEFMTKRLKELIGINTDEDLIRIDQDDLPEDPTEKLNKTDQAVTELEMCISRLVRIVEKEESKYTEEELNNDPEDTANTADEDQNQEEEGENPKQEDDEDVIADGLQTERLPDDDIQPSNAGEDDVQNKASDCVFNSVENIRL